MCISQWLLLREQRSNCKDINDKQRCAHYVLRPVTYLVHYTSNSYMHRKLHEIVAQTEKKLCK